MKASILAIVLLAITMTGLAQANNRSDTCPGVSHAHRHSDLRVAIIEVEDVNRCSFDYVDLEEQTTDLDHHMLLAEDFAIAHQQASQEGSAEVLNVILPRKHLKRGLRGTMMYCGLCKTAFLIKMLSDTER